MEVPFGSVLPVSGLGCIAAVVADVGDPAVALLLDHGLIGAAGLQVVVADQLHVVVFRRTLGRTLCSRGCRKENRQGGLPGAQVNRHGRHAERRNITADE